MTRQTRYILAVTTSLCCVGAAAPFHWHLLSAASLPTRAASPAPQASLTLDQTNTPPWQESWTNLLNDARQTFTPSLPTLVAVEVQLVLANRGEADDTLTMTLFDSAKQSLAASSRTVVADRCDHVLFDFPQGGVTVSPGQVYSIQLRGGPTFGWKYVEGGYENGDAWLNDKPLLPGARSTFLFRTFGVLEADTSSDSAQQVLSLNRANDGQRVAATVGQRIELTLQTIGPGHFEMPQVSSPAIRFVSVTWPRAQNPGGPTQVFRFDAAAEGRAEVQIPHGDSNTTFTITIQVAR